MSSMCTFVNSLKSAMPDLIKTDDDAKMVYDIFASVIVNGLKNRDVVEMEGIGEFRSEKDKGRKHIIFTPDPILISGVNE